MFTKSRPVPSKAALRALYQLAYISSGTAVGVATLCAEERRRKTRLLQAIADNAKRLRDSPRHVHNAALASAPEPAYEAAPYDHHAPKAPQHADHDNARSTSRSRASSISRRSVQDPDLPSQVEKGYAQVQAKERRRKKARAAGEQTTRRNGDVERTIGHRKEPGTVVTSARAGVAQVVAPFTQPGVHNAHPRSMAEAMRDPDYRMRPPPNPNPRPIPGAGPRRRTPTQAFVKPTFRTRPIEVKATGKIDTPPIEDVIEDVDRFLKSAPWPEQFRSEELNTAYGLLALALQSNSHSDIRSLLLFSFAIGDNSYIPRADRIVELLRFHLASLVPNTANAKKCEIIAEVFGTGRMCRLPGPLQWELSGSFATASLILCGEENELGKSLLHAVMTQNKSSPSIDDLHLAAKRFLKRQDFASTLQILDTWFLYNKNMPVALYDEVFRIARINTRMSVCKQVIDKKIAARRFDKALAHQYESMFSRCLHTGDSQLLRRLCQSLCEDSDLVRWVAPRLKDSIKLGLGKAILEDREFASLLPGEFQTCLPLEMQREIIGLQYAEKMKRKWRSTHNLTAVRELVDEASSEKARAGLSAEEFAPVELALVEIVSDSGSSSDALELLRHIDGRGLMPARTLCVSAAVLAKSGAWAQLDEVLRILEQELSQSLDVASVANLNKALFEFSLCHDVRETIRLAKSMIDHHILPVSHVTIDIVLQSLVDKKELALIPKWLDYTRKLGVDDLEGYGKSVANMMTHYYLNFRPPSALLMGMCRNLLDEAFLQNQADFVDLAKEATGYDLRHGTGNPHRMPYLRRLAGLNAMQLEHSNGKFPTKVFQKADAIDHSLAEDLGFSLGGNEEHADPSGAEDFLQASTTAPQVLKVNSIDSHDSSHENIPELSPGASSSLYLQRLERDLLFRFSRKKYREVLDLYKDSTASTYAAVSSRALEIAVEACIRLHHGQVDEAERMVEQAKSAGMNTSRASGPLLVQALKRSGADIKRDANTIRSNVIAYYQANENSGWQISHHVAVRAADTLIRAHCPRQGINLLSTIYRSGWATERPFDIGPMTVYMKGFIALHNERGIKWVVSHILRNNLRVSVAFLHELRLAARALTQEGSSVSTASLIQLIRASRLRCSERRMQQKKAGGEFGWQLLRCILRYSRKIGLATRKGPPRLLTRRARARQWRRVGYRRRTCKSPVAFSRSRLLTSPPLSLAFDASVLVASRSPSPVTAAALDS